MSCPDFDRHFVSRVPEMDADADVIVVFGGTNDFGHGDAPIGTMSDREDTTFYGGLHALYTALIEKYPAARIVILTPTHRLNEDNPCGDGNKPEDVGRLIDYVRIIREVAEFYSLPVLDLFAASGIQPRVKVLQERYMPDGLHPNDAGNARLAEVISAFLRRSKIKKAGGFSRAWEKAALFSCLTSARCFSPGAFSARQRIHR